MEKVKECRWWRKAVLAFIFILLLGFCPETWAGGLTYWAANGVPIVTATGDQGEQLMTSDGGSGAILVWLDQRGGSYAVYAQRIDSKGNPLWTTNGVAIYTGTTVGSASPRLTIDGTGGAIIFWADTRSNNSIYAQRVNGSGQLLWNPTGVLITNSLYVATDSGQYRVITDGSGGAIVCWQDGRSFATSERNIYAQRVDADGNVQWTANGVAIVTAPGRQQNPRMDDDGAGGAIIAWQDYRGGSTSPKAYVQRINESGTVQWAANGISLTPSSLANGPAFPLSDNKGGAYIAWRDYRGGAYTFYAQRVNSSGTPLWAGGGVPISGAVGSASTYGGAIDVFGEPYVVWRDITYTAPSYSTTGLFAQKIDAAGTILWGATGIQVSTAPVKPSSSSYNVSVGENSAGGIIVTWDDFRNGNWDIYAQEVDAAGNMLWNANGMALSTAPYDQQSPSIRTFNNGIIVAWRDSRNSGSNGYDIYAQRAAGGERYLSHFDSTEGSWWTGIALANPNSSSATVALTAYNQSGAPTGNSSITLPANGQKVFQVKDQLSLSGTGWIQIIPNKQLVGLEIFGNIASGSLAGLSPSRKPSSNFGFSHFDTTSDWWTGIALANPHNSSAKVTLTAYNQSGTSIGSSTMTLPANGQTVFQVKDQLGASGTGWIGVESDQPIVGLEIFGNIATGQITGVPASTYPSATLYVSHFDTTAEWWTGIALANPNSSQATVTLTAYNQSGTEIGSSTITLPAHGQTVFQVKDPPLSVSGTTGWIRMEADQFIVGLEILGSVTSGGLAGLVAPNAGRNNLAFSHFDTTADWWTEIALANPNDSSASITLTAYDQSGTVIGTSTITLPANGQKFFQVKDQLGVTGTGWVNAISDQPIVGLELFGNVATGQITGILGVLP
jgi:hypothetical protein